MPYGELEVEVEGEGEAAHDDAAEEVEGVGEVKAVVALKSRRRAVFLPPLPPPPPLCSRSSFDCAPFPHSARPRLIPM